MNRILIIILLVLINRHATGQTLVTDSVVYENVWRNYRIFLPTGFNTANQRPLVFNLHGYTSNAIEQELYTGFDSIADTANFLVCYPNGLNNSWNILGGFPNDAGFIDTLITLFINQYNVDPGRIYSTGLSNGGFMSNLLGCELAGRIAAIAPVAGSTTIAMQQTCSPARRMPVLYIQGDADPVVNYNGGSGYLSAGDLMNLWSSLDGCSGVPDTFLLPDLSPSDNCRAQRITWQNCDSAQVIHYRILGGGHTWPGSLFTIGITNQDFKASVEIWNFFNQYRLVNSVPETERKISRVFPNPPADIIHVELPFNTKSRIKLFADDGRLVHSQEQQAEHFSIAASPLRPGLYQLTIDFDNGRESHRIVIMK